MKSTNKLISLILVFVMIMSMAAPAYGVSLKSNNQTEAKAAVDKNDLLNKMNLVEIPFIKNEGQLKNKTIKYYADVLSGKVYVSDSNIAYSLISDNQEHMIVENFVDSKDTVATGSKEADTKVNYFSGNENNYKNIKTYSQIMYEQVYENISVHLNAYGNNVEKIFEVKPNGDTQNIKVEILGTDKLSVSDKGELVINTPNGILNMTSPVAYQIIDGIRTDVAVKYDVKGNVYGFEVGKYNHNYTLIIDPMLASTVFGGDVTDSVNDMVIDKDGNVYLTGNTSTGKFPNTTTSDKIIKANYIEWDTWSGQEPDVSEAEDTDDVFVLKMSSDLKTLLAATYIGGSERDNGYAITLDDNGDVYIGGRSNSTGIRNYKNYFQFAGFDWQSHEYEDEPITLEIDKPVPYPVTENAIFKLVPGTEAGQEYVDSGVYGIFVTKLNSNLDEIKASTFISQGKTGQIDTIKDMAVDKNGDLVVVGSTQSPEGLPQNGMYPFKSSSTDNRNGFVVKLNSNLSEFKASTYLGAGGKTGNVVNCGTQIDDVLIDSNNNIYVAGHTNDENYPVTDNAYNRLINGTGNNNYQDGFVTKLNSGLNQVLESTFVGGNGYDADIKIALDGGSLYVAGVTWSDDFKFGDSAPQSNHGDDGSLNDMFILKLDSNMSKMEGGTYCGGKGREDIGNIAVGNDGVYMVGATKASNISATDGADKGNIILAKYFKDLSQVAIITTIGDGGYSSPTIVGVYLKGNEVIFAGEASGPKYPTTDGAYSNGNGSLFITKFSSTLSHASAQKVSDNKTLNSNKTIFTTGDDIYIDVIFDAYVNVDGIPELKLNCSKNAVAVYQSGSGSKTLTFKYTVQQGDETTKLNYTSVNDLTGTINDLGNDISNMTLPKLMDNNALQYSNLSIDTTAPIVQNVTSNSANNVYTEGAIIPIEVTFDEKVTVTGKPELILNTVPENNAVYKNGSGSNKLVFEYKVGATDKSSDLDYKDVNSLILNGGTIKDKVKTEANLTLPINGSENSLGGQRNIIIDNDAVKVTKVFAVNEPNNYGKDANIDIVVNFSQNVMVQGVPTLKLKFTSTTTKNASYISGSGTSQLMFRYTVKDGDNVANPLNYQDSASLELKSGASIDGNNGIRTSTILPDVNSENSLKSSEIGIDTTKPKISSTFSVKAKVVGWGNQTNFVSSSNKMAANAGKEVLIQLTFNEEVTVQGNPYITVTTGKNAVYTSGSGTQNLEFIYTVADGDKANSDIFGFADGVNSLVMGEGSIKDSAGNDADIKLPKENVMMPYSLKYIYIDTEMPVWQTGTLEATDITQTSLKLTWPKADGGVSQVKSYEIYKDGVLLNTIAGSKCNNEPTTNTYDVAELTENTSYVFKVTAKDWADNEIAEPLTLTAKTKEPVLLVPPTLGISGNEIKGKDVVLTFADNENWRNSVNKVTVNTTEITTEMYTLTEGKLTIKGSCFAEKDVYKYSATISAAGHSDTTTTFTLKDEVIPDFTVYGNAVNNAKSYTVEELNSLEISTEWPPTVNNKPMTWSKYSTVNTYGTAKLYAASGVKLSYLLEQSGVEDYAAVIFYATDAQAIAFTREQLESNMYYYPTYEGAQPVKVEPIISFAYSEGQETEPDFANMQPKATARLFFGQNYKGQMTNNYMQKNIWKIEVVKSLPTENIVAPAINIENNVNIIGQDVKLIYKDDGAWTKSIHDIKINDKFIGKDDVIIENGKITLKANNFKTIGDYAITVMADGYMDSNISVKISSSDIRGQYVVSAVKSDLYTSEYNKDGVLVMNVKSGTEGKILFDVNIVSLCHNTGDEDVIFVHYSNGEVKSLVICRNDFDIISKLGAEFDVKSGDCVKVFVLDKLNSLRTINPIVLQ